MPFSAFLFPSELDILPHCSSAILNPKYVLTAAHCCYSPEEGNDDPLERIFVSEEKKIPGICKEHHQYEHPSSSDVKRIIPYDIALIEMIPKQSKEEKSLTMSRTVRPICITDEDIEEYMKTTAVVTGRDQDEDRLSYLNFTVTDLGDCLNFENKNKYSETEIEELKRQGIICAKQERRSEDEKFLQCKATQRGDSGGPLMVNYNDLLDDTDTWLSRWELIGLVSQGSVSGINDCDSNSFTLFSSVITHRNFIYKTMRADSGDDDEDDDSPKNDFCSRDNKLECSSCDEGFILKGRKCQPGFGTGPNAYLGTGTKFFDGNYCSERCPEVMHCEEDDGKMIRTAKVKYNKCVCHHGEPRKTCNGKEQSCHPNKCFDHYTYNSETDTCDFDKSEQLNINSVAMYLAKECETKSDAQSVIGDHYCSRMYFPPFNKCSVPVNEFYFSCIKDLCLKGRVEREEAICDELSKYENACYDKIGEFDQDWHPYKESKSIDTEITNTDGKSQSAFQVTDRGEGYVSIDLKGTNMCLDVKGSMFHDNIKSKAMIVLGHYMGRTDQLWTKVPVNNDPYNSEFYYKTKDKPQFALHHDTENDRLVIDHFDGRKDNQKFKLRASTHADLDLSTWRTENFCFKCTEKNHHRGEDGKCVPNKCICRYGHPVPDSECTSHGDEQCDSCKYTHVLTKYKHFDAVANFFEARSICHDNNMVLAKVLSQKDSDDIQQLLMKVNHHKLNNKDLTYNGDKSYAFYIGAESADGYLGSHADKFYWLNEKDVFIRVASWSRLDHFM